MSSQPFTTCVGLTPRRRRPPLRARGCRSWRRPPGRRRGLCALLEAAPQRINASTRSATRLRERHRARCARLKQRLNCWRRGLLGDRLAHEVEALPRSVTGGASRALLAAAALNTGRGAGARPVAECGKCDMSSTRARGRGLAAPRCRFACRLRLRRDPRLQLAAAQPPSHTYSAAETDNREVASGSTSPATGSPSP